VEAGIGETGVLCALLAKEARSHLLSDPVLC
jgi:hypothetical protein